jgi:ADP-ribosylglycohydrolase
VTHGVGHRRAAGPLAFQIPARPVLSDDTELTLATCESIIEHGRADPENVASHFLRWFLAGRVHGIGSSTLKAMRDLAIGTHWGSLGPLASSQPVVGPRCGLLRWHSC